MFLLLDIINHKNWNDNSNQQFYIETQSLLTPHLVNTFPWCRIFHVPFALARGQTVNYGWARRSEGGGCMDLLTETIEVIKKIFFTAPECPMWLQCPFPTMLNETAWEWSSPVLTFINPFQICFSSEILSSTVQMVCKTYF